MSSSSKIGYQGFGSFMSDNVEELLRIPESDYQPPKYPEFTEELELIQTFAQSSDFQFGEAFKNKFSLLDPNWTFINHGAFGACLAPIFKCSQQWYMEQKYGLAEQIKLIYFDF